MKASPIVIKRIPKDQIRSVYNPTEDDADHAFLSLFIKNQEERKGFSDIFAKKQKDIPRRGFAGPLRYIAQSPEKQ